MVHKVSSRENLMLKKGLMFVFINILYVSSFICGGCESSGSPLENNTKKKNEQCVCAHVCVYVCLIHIFI